MILFIPIVSSTNLQQPLPHLVSRPHGRFEDPSTSSWVVLKGTVNVIPYFKKLMKVNVNLPSRIFDHFAKNHFNFQIFCQEQVTKDILS